MSSKYKTIYTLSLTNQFVYRFNFLLGRLRNIIVLVILYALYSVLTHNSAFAGYTQTEFITYIFLMHILRSFVFGPQSRLPASEINDGTFSMYLVKPVKHYFYTYFRELSERVLLIFASIIEIALFWIITQPEFFLQTNGKILILFAFSVLLAHVLYALFSYLVSLLAFWSREAHGPRFLFEWILEFASGTYFPLNILSSSFFLFLQFLPFMYMLYVPIQIYLGKITFAEALTSFSIQILWAMILSGLIFVVWKKGLKKYTGEGL